jgi:predicted RNA-binding Zn-ribbon protein involved in translation (DUF1610 family)
MKTITCYKCYDKMQQVHDAYDKQRGGKYVAIGTVAEIVDTVSEWQCPNCGAIVYLSDKNLSISEIDELGIDELDRLG